MLNDVQKELMADLTQAIRSEDVLRVALMTRQSDVKAILNKKNSNRVYPIQETRATLNLDIIKMLVDSGANPSVGGSKSLIIEACIHNNANCIDYLLDNGVDVTRDLGMHFIPFACEYVTVDILKLLLSKGVSLDWYNHDDQSTSPLYAAYLGDNPDVFHYLLTNHLDQVKSSRDEVLAYMCKTNDDKDLIKVMLSKYKANPNVLVCDEATRNIPLLHAVIKSYGFPTAPIVKLLIKYGADTTIVDEYGKTALDWAKETGDEELIKLLS